MQNVNELIIGVDLSNPEVAELVMNDPDITKLQVGSEEFKSAMSEKLNKKKEEDSEDVASDGDVEDQETTEVDSEDEESNEETPKENVKSKKGKTARIDELTRDKRQAQRELEAARQEIERLKKATSATQQPVEADEELKPPRYEDFDHMDDYNAARDEYVLAKFRKEQETQKQTSAIEQDRANYLKTWQKAYDELTEQYPDVPEVVNSDVLNTVELSNGARLAIKELGELGPVAVYTLLKDEEMLADFMEASEVKQIKIIGKIEDRIARQTDDEPVVRKATKEEIKLPKPLSKGKSTSSVYRDPIKHAHEMSFEEWDRAVDKQLKKYR